MALSCTNLELNDEGEYEDPISLEVIPRNRLVHLPMGDLQFCYDALELLRYIRSQQNERRSPSLPDNRNLLLPAGVDEVRRVARLSFPQRYQVAGPRGQFPSFNTEEEAQVYVRAQPGRNLSFYSFADLPDDPLIEDLLYPDGLEETPTDPIPGPYFNEAGMRERAVHNRQQEEEGRAARNRQQEEEGRAARNRERAARDYEQEIEQRAARNREREAQLGRIEERRNHFANERKERERKEQEYDEEEKKARQPRDDEIEIGNKLARKVGPGTWRCGSKESIFNFRSGVAVRRRFGVNLNGDDSSSGPIDYCSSDDINRIREYDPDAKDPHEWGFGERISVDGELVSLEHESGIPSCSNDGLGELKDICRPDLVEEVAARHPRHYIKSWIEGNQDHEVEYRFDRPSQQFKCRDSDGVEYDCSDDIREDFDWGSIEEDPDIIHRKLSRYSPIECATKEQWHTARQSGDPIPWSVCTEEQRVYLRDLYPEYFENMEQEYDELDEDPADDYVAEGRFDIDENIDDDEEDYAPPDGVVPL